MPAILPSSSRDQPCPTFLSIGHVTRDLLPEGGFTLGGTATFAALTAYHLGLVSAVVTRADEALLAELPSLLAGIALAASPASVTTAFENSYSEGFRVQHLRARAPQLEFADVPAAWLAAPIILLGPLAQEIPPALIRALPRQPGSLLAATPQGWLRRWDTDGRVWPAAWEDATEILPLLDVLILSHDDLLPFADNQRDAADAMLAAWSTRVPLLVATDGRHGATLFEGGLPTRFPAYPATEVDPTGAGDVFAAAFLVHLYQHHDPRAAMNFANCVASLSVEGPGITGIPTLEEIQQRLRTVDREKECHMFDQQYLLNEQYTDSARLKARIRLHELFSTNRTNWQRWVFDQLAIAPGSSILELGTGPGLLWQQNLDRIPADWEITLSDFSPGMLADARQNLGQQASRFQFAVVDAQSIPYPENTFDCVIANHMLYHVPDRARAFAEIRRVLRPDGHFYATANGGAHLHEIGLLCQRAGVTPGGVLGAFGESPFTLHNGAAQMAPWFEQIEVRELENSLAVTEADPLLAFILSSLPTSSLDAAKLQALRALIEREIAADGMIRISKESGLFIAYGEKRGSSNEASPVAES